MEGRDHQGIHRRKGNGKPSYEVEVIVNGYNKDVEMDVSGAVVEVEQEIAMDSIPKDVKAGSQQKLVGARLWKIESITKNGKLVADEAKVETAGKKLEIQVSPDRKPLDRKE